MLQIWLSTMTTDLDNISAIRFNLRSANKALRKGDLRRVLSEIEKIDTTCLPCQAEIESGKEIVKEAIVQCDITGPNGKDECENLVKELAEILHVLEEGYSLT